MAGTPAAVEQRSANKPQRERGHTRNACDHRRDDVRLCRDEFGIRTERIRAVCRYEREHDRDRDHSSQKRADHLTDPQRARIGFR